MVQARNPTSLILSAQLQRGDPEPVEEIAAAVRHCTGRVQAAAEWLGIPYTSLLSWRARYPAVDAAIVAARASHGDDATLARVQAAASPDRPSVQLETGLKRADPDAEEQIAAALRRSAGTLGAAARLLGVPRAAMTRWRDRYPTVQAAVDAGRLEAATQRAHAGALGAAQRAAAEGVGVDTSEPSDASRAALLPAARGTRAGSQP